MKQLGDFISPTLFLPLFHDQIFWFPSPWTSEVIKFFSSLLSFLMDHILTSVFISPIPISMISGIWSDGLWILGWSICWLNPVLPGERKMRSIMELALCGLSANLVGPGFKEGESSRPKLSAIVMRSLVWEEWCWKLGFQLLSFILKSLVC